MFISTQGLQYNDIKDGGKDILYIRRGSNETDISDRDCLFARLISERGELDV